MRTGRILAGGAALVRDQPAAVAIWAVLYLGLSAASAALVWPLAGEMLAWQQSALAAQATPMTPPLPPTGLFGGVMLIQLVMLVVLAAIFAAAVRAVARGGRDPYAFLRLGMDEARLIGLGFVLVVLGMVVSTVFAVLMVVVTLVLVYFFAAPALLAILPLYAVWVGVQVWIGVRLSLAGAFTVLCGRIVVREAWAATRGRFWSLFGAYPVILLAFVAVSLLALAVTYPALLSGEAWLDPDDMLAVQQTLIADLFGPRAIALMVVGAAMNALLFALFFGAIATAATGYERMPT